jgi:hypothetical protein
MRGFKVTITVLILSLPLAGFAVPDDQNDLLKARELVWRAWFAGDTKTLTDLLPPETIAISRDAIPSMQDHFEFAVASE